MSDFFRIKNRIARGSPLANTFSSQIFITILTNVLLGVLGLVTGSLTARLLGPQGRGEFAAIQTWGLSIATLAMIGLPDAVVYFSSRAPRRATEYMVSAIALLLICTIPFAILGYISIPFLLAAQSETTISIARLYLVCYIFFQATQGMLLHPLRGRRDFTAWNLLRIFPIASWLIVLLTLWVVGNTTTDFLTYGFLFSIAIVAIPMGWIVLQRLCSPVVLNSNLWSPMLKYSYPLLLSSIPQSLNMRLDQMLIAAFLVPQLLGYYVVGVAWSSIASPLLGGIAGVVFPRIAGQSSLHEQVNTLARVIRFSVFVSGTLTLVMWFVTPFGIPLLFGNTYTPAIQIASMLVAVAGISGINTILEEGLRGLGQTTAILTGEIAGLVALFLSSILLLNPLLSLGVGFAALIGRLVTMLILITQIARITRADLTTLMLIRRDDWQLLWQRLRSFATGIQNNIR